jgi:hypothetical protein
MYEGQSHHGAFLKLYVNEPARMALSNNQPIMPDNTIIVKENYDENKNLVAITPMYKVRNDRSILHVLRVYYVFRSSKIK